MRRCLFRSNCILLDETDAFLVRFNNTSKIYDQKHGVAEWIKDQPHLHLYAPTKRLVSVGTNTDYERGGIEKGVSWKENQNKSEVATLISEKQ